MRWAEALSLFITIYGLARIVKAARTHTELSAQELLQSSLLSMTQVSARQKSMSVPQGRLTLEPVKSVSGDSSCIFWNLAGHSR